MIQQIGTNAGKIWNVLSTRERATVKQLRDATKLTQNDVLLALGWLAREHKVSIDKKGVSYVVSLEEARVSS